MGGWWWYGYDRASFIGFTCPRLNIFDLQVQHLVQHPVPSHIEFRSTYGKLGF